MAPFVHSGKLRVATDSDVLSYENKKITGLEFTVLPIPHTLDSQIKRSARSSAEQKTIRIIHLGWARIEKGIDVIADAIPLLDAELASKKIEFVIQCNINISSAELEAAIRRLEQLTRTYPEGLRLIKQPMNSDAYYSELRNADAVILPYRKAFYAARTSGIMTECIAAGKPVIVTEETWLGYQAQKSAARILVKDGDAQDVAQAIRTLVENYRQLSAEAEQKRIAWQEFHNADRLLDILLEEK
jgi:glycosyltransferase involved in cell wall biosynthesis